jgi:hypothetical protein
MRAGPTGSGCQVSEPSCIFTAWNSKSAKIPGGPRDEAAGGAEVFLKTTGRKGFVHPHPRECRWIGAFRVEASGGESRADGHIPTHRYTKKAAPFRKAAFDLVYG